MGKNPMDKVSERRRMIRKAMMRGISTSTLAVQFKVSDRQIQKDKEIIRKEIREEAENIKMGDELAYFLAANTEIIEEAMTLYNTTGNVIAKVQSLKLAGDRLDKRIVTLQAVGVIESPAERLELDVNLVEAISKARERLAIKKKEEKDAAK